MFSSSIVCAVGGIASVSSSASFAYWSRMWLSWPSSRRAPPRSARGGRGRRRARRRSGRGRPPADDTERGGRDHPARRGQRTASRRGAADPIVRRRLGRPPSWSSSTSWSCGATATPFASTSPIGAVRRRARGVAVRARPRVGWIGTICVAPDLRGRGLGRALTQARSSTLDRRRRPLARARRHVRGPPALRADGLRGPDCYRDPRGTGTDAAATRRRARVPAGGPP